MNTRVLTLFLCFAFVGCQTSNSMDAYMAKGIKPGMTEKELMEIHGKPTEVELLTTGEKRLSHFFVTKNIHRDVWGRIHDAGETPKRLDVFLNPSGIVARHEILEDPLVDETVKLFMEANAANSNGDFKTALQLFDELLVSRPHHLPAREVRASIYVRLGNAKEAQKDYETILKNDPYNHFANHNSAISYFEEGQYEKALEAFNNALKNHPDSALVHAYRARAYYKLGEKELAKADIEFAKKNGFVFTKELKEEFESYGIVV